MWADLDCFYHSVTWWIFWTDQLIGELTFWATGYRRGRDG